MASPASTPRGVWDDQLSGPPAFASVRSREPVVEFVCLRKPYIGADFPDRELNGSPQHGKRFLAVIHSLGVWAWPRQWARCGANCGRG